MQALEELYKVRDEPNDHVAYLRWAGDGEHKYLVLCDSDAEGAFKVYRRRGEP